MRRLTKVLLAAGLPLLAVAPASTRAACCYFAAKDKDVSQPSQKAFITWDPVEKVESFTVQPKFEGNASDFGMVIPTPARPKLDEMPRDTFKELAVFTILEPMDLTKYKRRMMMYARGAGRLPMPMAPSAAPRPTVRVLEAGVVGSLDYKIIEADNSDDLFQWLKDNNYSYSGDQKTLDSYVQRKWVFTAMKIDPKQMKKRDDGSYAGEITPTRFAFAAEKLLYPLQITRISVKDKTEALFYIQAPKKMDLPGGLSYEPSFNTMWSQALGFAVPEKVTAQEKSWQENLQPKLEEFGRQVQEQRQAGHEPATLEWSKKLGQADLDVLTGDAKYNREAPAEDVKNLKVLKGMLKKGLWVTKCRKVFAKDEMGQDLEFVEAKVGETPDEIEYVSILPTSPP